MLRLRVTTGVLAVAAALLVPAGASAAPDRFELGIQDPTDSAFLERDRAGAFEQVRSFGMSVVRIPVAWHVVAPTKPGTAGDPDDPAYTWTSVDGRVEEIKDNGLEPLIVLYGVPGWAKPANGRLTASAADYAGFAAAASRRYDGSGSRPRVRYWQFLNEPNLKTYLQDTPEHYRGMVNAAAKPVHAAAKGNLVVAGGLAPFSDPKDEFGIPPMRFMREMLCMSRSLRATCKAKSSFDVWSNHPYTSGGPTHRAPARDEASLGQLPDIRRLLRAAEKAGHVRGAGRARLWITEFSWDTNPPDPGGVPLGRHARWVAEAMYRMWQNDVSLLVWFQLRDNPAPDDGNWRGTFQAGLFQRTTDLYANEKRKPVAVVIDFPFAAVPERGATSVWGRTPDSRSGVVMVERRSGSKWRRIARLKAGRHGIFRVRVRGMAGATLRARTGGSTSLPYKAVRNRDIRVNAFGGDLPPR
jgi:hypothetical protein